MIQNKDQSNFWAKITKTQHKFLHTYYFVAIKNNWIFFFLKVILKYFEGESIVTPMPIGLKFLEFLGIMLFFKSNFA
jgi:hypothetical protein